MMALAVCVFVYAILGFCIWSYLPSSWKRPVKQGNLKLPAHILPPYRQALESRPPDPQGYGSSASYPPWFLSICPFPPDIGPLLYKEIGNTAWLGQGRQISVLIRPGLPGAGWVQTNVSRLCRSLKGLRSGHLGVCLLEKLINIFPQIYSNLTFFKNKNQTSWLLHLKITHVKVSIL